MVSPSQQPPAESLEELPQLSRFEVLRRLGQGGAGLVYEAIDRARGSRVALKTLHGLDGESLLNLKEEFRALQDIQHRNIIRLEELHQEKDVFYFTMELVDGANFLAYVSGSRGAAASQTSIPVHRGVDVDATPPVETVDVASHSFDEARLRECLAQLARGLMAIHAAGKVHRDIKPSNVLVGLDGRVVILDFGLLADSSTARDEDGGIVGTVTYMAPEQASGDEIGPAADWYAVGVMLYECLTGGPPFDGSPLRVLEKKLEQDPASPRELVAAVAEDLDELCMELLQRDARHRADGARVLEALHKRTISVPATSRQFASAQSHFVGRRREFDALVEAFHRVRDGQGCAVVAQGESGVGKTALVRRFVRRLPSFRDDVVVLSGRCYEREDVPYKAIDGVMDALSRYAEKLDDDRLRELLPEHAWVLCQVFPVLGRLPAVAAHAIRPEGFDVQESRAQLFVALRELLTRLGHRHPLVLLIDDLQWADADSFALLRDLLRPPTPPLLLIATAREPKEPHPTSPFGLPGAVKLLAIDRLAEDEAVELATRLVADAKGIDPTIATAIAKEAQGHPLFIDELVRHATFTGEIELSHVSLDDALYARAKRLEPGARALLDLLCIAGVALPQDTVRDALGIDYGEFVKHVTTLRGAHLARTAGWRGEDAIETYHNRVREAVADRLSAETCTRCHQQLALALERAASTDAESLYAHWLGAGEREKAGRYALTAADAAYAAFAFEQASRLYERAIELCPGDDGKLEARRKLAEALANAGYCHRAAKVFADAAKVATAVEAIELRRRAAEELLLSGAIDEGRDAMVEALAAAGLHMPRHPLLALVGFLWGRLCVWLGAYHFVLKKPRPDELVALDTCLGIARVLSIIDTISATYFGTRALLMALRAGEASRIALGMGADTIIVATAGMKAGTRAARLYGLAVALAEETNDPVALGSVKSSTGLATFMQGRFPKALALGDEAAEILRRRCTGAFWYLRNAQLVGIWALSWMGELDELQSRMEARTREAEQRGDLYSLCVLGTGQPALAWLRGGDSKSARERAEDVTQRWSQRGFTTQRYWSTLALMRLDLYDGHPIEAVRRIEYAWPRAKRSLMFEAQIIYTEALHLRATAYIAAAAAERGGDRARWLRWARGAARTLARSSQPYAPALVSSIGAGLAMLDGDVERAARELRQAVACFDDVSMALFVAVARWELGALLGGAKGAELKAEADDWMHKRGIARGDRIRAMLLPGFERP